ncbi:ribonuclease H-like domain-containing protein [Dissophora ornata]|nr:ribonuclease H-like domain-containing protein [Dissophora ornata]
MEILKADFEASLPLLQKAITECDFVAMDTEMTGLASPANIPKFQDSLSTRYSKVSVSAANFLVIQLGICTFTWSDDIGGYEARPFNFPCFPSSADEAKAGERFFKCQSTSLEFLLNNGFDFNKWIRHGIPYLTRPEEEAYIMRKTEKTALHAAVSTTSSNIPIDDRNREFVETTIAKIKEWLQSPEEPLTVSAPNSFFRRLVYQVVRTDFNDELHVAANAQARTMTIQQYTDEIRYQQEQAKLAKPPMLNLRRVLDMISDARKPLIGHNCFLDLMQISQQFLWDLPLELDDWKRALMLEWDTIIDTKHLAGHPLISPLLPTTALETVSESVQKAPFATVGPKIVMAENFNRYLADASVPVAANVAPQESVTKGEETKDDPKYHEAGYDAYITGQAFLRFTGYIIKERQRLMVEDEEHTRKKRRLVDGDIEVDDVFARAIQAVREAEPALLKAQDEKQEVGEDEEEEEGEVLETETEKDAILEKRKRVIMDNPTTEILETEELRDYYNLLHMMRSDIPVMNLAGPDLEPEERPWCFLLKNIPSGFQTSTLFHLFRSYNPFRFNWIDGTTASIQLNGRGFKWSSRGGPASSAPQACDGQGLGSGLPEREGVAAVAAVAAASAHTVGTKRKHGEDHTEHNKVEN